MKNGNKRMHKKVEKNEACCPNMEKTLALAHGHENHNKWEKKTKKQNVGRQKGKQA